MRLQPWTRPDDLDGRPGPRHARSSERASTLRTTAAVARRSPKRCYRQGEDRASGDVQVTEDVGFASVFPDKAKRGIFEIVGWRVHDAVPTFVRPMYASCSRNSEISEKPVR